MRMSLKMSSKRATCLGREAAAEVARGGRIGDAAGAQGIEEDFVVAAQFDVLQAGAVAQGVVGEVEDVIGLVVGQVELEQVQAVVDGVDEAELAGQEVHGADAAVADAAAAVADFIVDVAGGEHGLGAAAQVGLGRGGAECGACGGPVAGVCLAFTRNPLVTGLMSWLTHSSNPGNAEGFRVFSRILPPSRRQLRLVKD